MKNKLWILVAVIVVVLAGVGIYFLQGPGGNLATIGNTSMRSLLASGASQKCTFTNENSNGTIYVGGGKMRGDFSSKSGEVAAQSHMIITNNIAYVWIDGMAQGYRMPFEDMTAQGASNGQGIDADAKVATKCESWQASDVSFTLPTDVTFSEVSAGAQNGAAPTTPTATTSSTSGTSVKAGADTSAQTYAEQQCTACNMITDATAKAQCKASFDCR
jgi:hypothetical protein